jgi:hypothetical protein
VSGGVRDDRRGNGKNNTRGNGNNGRSNGNNDRSNGGEEQKERQDSPTMARAERMEEEEHTCRRENSDSWHNDDDMTRV